MVWRTGSGGRRLVLHQGHQPVEGAGDRLDRAGRDLGVERGCLELGVPEQHLDDPDIDILLQEVRGKAVPKGVGTDPLADACNLGRLLHRPMQLSR
jgi:hypothetical protein